MVTLAVALVIFVAYAAGRVHEWYRHSYEREQAYRDGYDRASHSLFQVATRSASGQNPDHVYVRSGSAGPARSTGSGRLTSASRRQERDLTRIDPAGAA